MGIFNRGSEIKALQNQIKELKGYYDQGKNVDNKYLQQMMRTQINMVEFASFKRQQLSEAYQTNTAIFGIVDRISKAVGELGRYIELVDADGNVVEQHPLLDVLKRPNDRMKLKTFLYAWATNYLVFGDAFVYAKKALGKDRGSISEMYVMSGQEVNIEKGNENNIIKGVFINGEIHDPINPSEYFQSFIYNLDSTSLYGFSPLIAAAYDVQLLKSGKERLNTSLTNGGVSAIITPARDKDGFVVPQTADAVEDELNSKKNVNKNKFFRQAIEVHQLGNTPVDLSILDSSKESVTALCFAYGIPVDLYYGQSKYENAKEAKKTLYESAAIPLLEQFLEDFHYFAMVDRSGKTPKYDAELEKLHFIINTDKIDVLKENATEMLQAYNLAGASLNEKRDLLGLAQIEEDYANEPMIPLGTQFGDVTYDFNEPTE
jgi:HK97 family phage portal protein